MSLNKYLESSWNFDTVTGSDGSGAFLVDDTSNENYGKATGLTANTSSMVLKEELKTGRKQHYETLEGLDTIQLVDTDDERLSGLEKPSSVKLMVENSMYQIVSDEMLNLFASVDDYAFRFSIPDNKYKSEYEQLLEARALFFEKVLEKPNLEKYIEFYKWIDSSLGDLIDQLKPENSSEFSGLKTTVESHILERSKYQHILPVTVGENKIYTNPDRSITVVRNTSANAVVDGNTSGPYKQPFLQGGIAEVAKIENNNTNFKNNYEVFQGAGKYQNNRTGKTNKSIIQTKFSSGDGLSENNRYADGEEFSVYNEINQRATNQKNVFNTSQSIGLGTQGQNTTASSTTINNFRDNNFIQRSIPYTSSNYHEVGVLHYEQIPGLETEFRQRNNILIDAVETGLVVIEPPVEFTVPAKHTLKVKNAFEDIEVYSPYNSKIDTFSPRTLQETGTLEQGFTAYFDRDIGYVSDEDTFFRKIQNLPTGQVEVKRVEILDNIYPRKDLMGRAETRTKPNYEEIEGVFNTSSLTWSRNSYNNNSAQIRSFWKDDITARRRTRGTDTASGTGSINCLGEYNLDSFITSSYLQRDSGALSYMAERLHVGVFDESRYYDDGTGDVEISNWYLPLNLSINYNYYDSIFSLDSYSQTTLTASKGRNINNTSSVAIIADYMPIQFGDIAPYNDSELLKFVFAPNIFKTASMGPRAKPQFIYRFNAHYTSDVLPNGITLLENKSYTNFNDPDITPFYDKYDYYFSNIKGRSHNESIIPEFLISNFPNVINEGQINSSYLTLLGIENLSAYSSSISSFEEYFISDFKKFINPNSNKIKIKFNALKKLLPYNGFYPQQRSVQIVKNFSDTYLENNFDERSKQTIIQPFFAPGILFNTIKAGLAMPYTVALTTGSVNENTLYFGSYPDAYDYNTVNSRRYTINNSAPLVKIPFEAMLEPDKYLFSAKYNNYKLAYLDPCRYNDFFTNNSSSLLTFPYVNIASITGSTEGNNLKNYKKVINNFFAEIPNFFLDNGTLTTFISNKAETQFDSLTYNTPYEFKIQITKNNNFSMFEPISLNAKDMYEQTLFGPPINDDESAYAPPYYRNPYYSYPATEVILPNEIKISFTPFDSSSLSRKYTLDEILPNLTISSSSRKVHGTILSDCLNYKQKINDKQITYDSQTGLPKETRIDTANEKWVIQTKFETPLINFLNKNTLTSSIETIFNGTAPYVYTSGTYDQARLPQYITSSKNLTGSYFIKKAATEWRGIWSSYGSIPINNESVQITITDENVNNSLLKAVGFDKQTKSIGKIAKNKEISEAIVLLPYVYQKNAIKIEDPNLYWDEIEQKNFFKLPENVINNLLNISSYKKLKIEQIKVILETNAALDQKNTILDLIKKITNYNVPPHLNWLYDADKKTPINMYITEVKHTLTQEDLSNIWQGNLPEISIAPEINEVFIEHSLDSNQLFSGIDITQYDIRIKIFKIKKRANQNYYKLTADISDDLNYQFGINNGDIPWYSYNWPYDYFSLVELVNIQAGEVYEATGSV